MSYTIRWLSDKETYLPMKDTQETQVQFNLWVGKIPWRSKWQRIAVFLPGKSHGQRSLVVRGVRPGACPGAGAPACRDPIHISPTALHMR